MGNLIARTTVFSTLKNQFPVEYPSLNITELPLSGIIRIQGEAKDPDLVAAIESATQLALPLQDNFSVKGERRLAQVAPNEWLLFTPLQEELAQLTNLEKSFAGLFATATLISDSRVIFCVSGEAASDLLAKGSALDFDPEAFPVGKMRNTRFAGIAVAIAHLQRDHYLMYVDISYSDYALHWLIDAAAEFGRQTCH